MGRQANNFNVGDAVLIDINALMPYVNSKMIEDYNGTVQEIIVKYEERYKLKNCRWTWSDHMLKPASFDEDALFLMYVNEQITAENYEKLRNSAK